MRILVIALLLLCVLISFSAPTFYEAYIEHTVLRASRHIASDLIWTRREAIKTGKAYGVFFIRGKKPGYSIFIDNDSNGKFDPNDLVVKTVNLKDISSHVEFSDSFDDKGVVFVDNTVVFSGSGKPMGQNVQENDSIFLINDKDENRGLLDRIIRVYIDKATSDIKLLRVVEKTEKGDLIFGDIGS